MAFSTSSLLQSPMTSRAHTHKYALDALGGLVMTGMAGHDASFVERTALAILHTLQLDRSPVVMCTALHEAVLQSMTAASQDDDEGGAAVMTPCLIPLATRTNVFSSVVMPQDVSMLEEVLACPRRRSMYEGWEVLHLEATLAFSCFDFVRCAELCRSAVLTEPRDAFSARLLFISTFNCGRSALLVEALSSALPRIAPSPPLPPMDEVGEGGSGVAANLPFAEPFAARPFYHALLGFAMNEAGMAGGTAVPLHHALLALQQVRAYNRAALLGERWIHPFAVHTVCHLMGPTPLEGLRYIDEVIPRELWEPSAYFAVHLYYHIITMYIDSHQPVKAMAMYDDRLLPLAAVEDMYAVSDASSIVGRFAMADLLPHSDPRPAAVCDKWVRAAAANAQHISKGPFFVMNLVTAAVLLSPPSSVGKSVGEPESPLMVAGRKAALRCAEPFRTIFIAVLDADVATLTATKPQWRSIGGSKGQIDLLERFRVWALGRQNPLAAEAELRQAAIMAPFSAYYAKQADRYALLGAVPTQ